MRVFVEILDIQTLSLGSGFPIKVLYHVMVLSGATNGSGDVELVVVYVVVLKQLSHPMSPASHIRLLSECRAGIICVLYLLLDLV